MADYLMITGASAGIGLATAQHFLEQGFRVVNLSRRSCPLPAVQNFAVDLADGTVWDAVSEPLRQAVAPAERIILTARPVGGGGSGNGRRRPHTPARRDQASAPALPRLIDDG